MDDTDLYEYPALFVNVSKIKFEQRTYEDVDNAAIFILKVTKMLVIYLFYRKWVF